MKLSSLLAGTALLAGSVVSAKKLDPIVVKGQKFFYKSNGTEFFMRGVAYQQDMSSNGTTSGKEGYKDPLADAEACKRDVPRLQELNTNTIRVYAVDPKKDHKACMELLEEAGIYVVADLGEPKTSIIRDDPKWDDVLYSRYTAVIDELANYSNVLGFFAGNEVTNNKSNTEASAFVKAAVRDSKAYIKKKGYTLSVGYATNDDAEIRDDMTDYFNCGKKEESIDFWGYNIYSWCGDSSYTESGYDKVVKDFSNFNVPVFFAEYGCNNIRPRKFTEVGTIYGSKMTPVISGGIVYMYFEESNKYGLVKISGKKAEPNADFKNLKKQMAKVDPTGVQMDKYKPSNTALRTCPTSKTWKATEKLPPTPNKDTCKCMIQSLSCVAKDDLDEEDFGDLFGSVCGLSKTACEGINKSPAKGTYGVYSMCGPREQLSHAMNAYYQEQKKKGKGEDACDFKGKAKLQDAKDDSTCKKTIEKAEKDGLSPSSASTGGAGAESSTGAAVPLTLPGYSFGFVKFGAYLFCGVMAGASLILM